MPTWEEYWGKGGINDQKVKSGAPDAVKSSSSSSSGSSSTPYSQGNSYGVQSPTSSPPAITAAAKPQTNQSGQTQLPSWMGNMYSKVPGTDWYSTNPSNPNASKYRADGSPVASIGLSDDKGFKFDGYGSPEQFKQITDMAAGNNLAGIDQTVRGWINDGKLISNDSIYNNINKVVASGTSTGPAISAAAKGTGGTGSVWGKADANGNYGGYSGGTQINDSQRSAQDWINNSSSGQGGMDAYVKNQQAKYDYATRSGDQEMLNNLNKDMQRVGYSLNQQPASGAQGQQINTGNPNTGGAPSGSNGAMGGGGGYSPSGAGGFGGGSGGAIGTDIMNGIMQQVQAITQGLNSSQQANNTQVTQNNAQVAEQIAKMVKQKAIDLDNAVSFQNRRGGFYSGGIDTQKSAIENGYQEATGGLNRDVAARNDAIWSNNAMLAKQAADKIAMLQQQAPDQIRAAVSAAAAKQHQDDIEMAKLTGSYQDTAQVAAVRQKMAQNSADYALASPSRQKELHDENMRLAASIGGVDTTGNGDYSFGQGIRTLEGQKQDYNQYKDNRDFNYQAVRDSVADGKWTTETEFQMKKWAEQNNLDWARFDMDTKKAWAQIAISQQNANTSSASQKTSADRFTWDKEQAASKPKTIDYKTNPNFSSDVAHIKSNPDAATQLNSHAKDFIDAYGIDGYNELRKQAGLKSDE